MLNDNDRHCWRWSKCLAWRPRTRCCSWWSRARAARRASLRNLRLQSPTRLPRLTHPRHRLWLVPLPHTRPRSPPPPRPRPRRSTRRSSTRRRRRARTRRLPLSLCLCPNWTPRSAPLCTRTSTHCTCASPTSTPRCVRQNIAAYLILLDSRARPRSMHTFTLRLMLLRRSLYSSITTLLRAEINMLKSIH